MSTESDFARLERHHESYPDRPLDADCWEALARIKARLAMAEGTLATSSKLLERQTKALADTEEASEK